MKEKQVPLLSKHKMIRNVIDNAHAGINIFDRKGRRIFVNPYYYKLSGRKSGTRFPVTMQGATDKFLWVKVQETIKTGKVFEFYNRIYASKFRKAPIYNDVLIGPIKDKDGTITGAYAITEDVTARVKARKKALALTRTLEKKVKERTEKLNRANQKLKKTADEKTMLVSHVAHEIKTILTIIKGNIEIINGARKERNPLALESYQEIDREIIKLSKIVSDLVFVTKSEAYSNLFKIEQFDICEVIDDVIREHRVLNKDKNFKISLILKSPRPIKIYADQTKIQTLISNMIENAIKYGKENGKLQILVYRERNNIHLTFKDNGQGISPENLEYIFDPFFQARKTNNSKIIRGFGLGLAICKKIVTGHKGEIKVNSKLGKGTTFYITLPCKKSKN